ncbi:MAG TPA: DUF2231 domain-containing protein [Abditibacteriaceae bacterium]|jgi:uncharacterized membrane protein
MESLPLPQSNVQWHAALTHFPITLLFVAVFFDIVALFYKRPGLREFSLWMLTLCVISLPFSLLTGWLTGREFKRAPVGYDQHWQAAVITSVLALVLLVWRLASKDKMPRMARVTVLTLTMACAMGVGYTGHQGGEMTFGGRAAPVEAVAPPPANNSGQQIADAATRMAEAAGNLDKKTDRVLVAAATAKKPAPAPTPIVVTPTVTTVSPDALTNAANKLNEVASRFENTAEKMDRIAQLLESTANKPIAPVPTGPAIAKGTGGATGAGGKATPVPTESGPKLDPKLIAAGKQSFFKEANGCLDCHAMDGQGNAKNGDLTHVGSKPYDVEWHIAHLIKPKSKVPGSKMPPYDDLPAEELRALATYMVSKK